MSDRRVDTPTPWQDRPGIHFEGPQHVIPDRVDVIDLPPAPPGMAWVRKPLEEKSQ